MIRRRGAWLGCAASVVQPVGPAFGGASEPLALRRGEARRRVLPLAFALLVADDPERGEAFGGLGAVASWMDCRSSSSFLSTPALARTTVFCVAFMASASKLQP